MPLYGGIEAGGTKFVCAIGGGPDIHARIEFPTSTPNETIDRAIQWFQAQGAAYGSVDAIGIASFGPVDLIKESATYGHITSTPKENWANTNIVGAIEGALKVPVGFDTDVNGAALAEFQWGAGKNLDVLCYLTIGTGIGGGAVINGLPLHGLLHPEMGHFHIPHDRDLDPFAGVCPFHGNCFEGLASGTAISARWGAPAHTLSPQHPAWELEANYLALGLMTIICTLSPQRLLLGGGVMQRTHLFPLVREGVQQYLNAYLPVDAITSDIERYIQPPLLGNDAGITGAFALAELAIRGV